MTGLLALGCSVTREGVAELLGDTDRVTLVDTGIEGDIPIPDLGVDLIVSFNVCEHLADLEVALRNMAALLAPGGRMIHRIDYGPHDIWGDMNPLTFLTVPTPLWRMMSCNRGCPNRARHAQVMAIIRAVGLSVADCISNRAPEASVNEVRPYLAREFSDLSNPEIGGLDAEIVGAFDNQPQLGPAFRLDS